MNWEIEKNTFSGNQKAIRIAADQDHGIRPLPGSGELGYSAQKPINHVIRDNLFENNIWVIEEVDCENTSIGPNELRNNLYE